MASAKNQLQEILQKAGQRLPRYEVEGTPQYGVFKAKVTVQWEGRTMEEWGQGQKKKAAEMAAAENMLKRIREKRMSPAVCSGGRLTMPLIEPRTPPNTPPREIVNTGPRTPLTSPHTDTVGPRTPTGSPTSGSLSVLLSAASVASPPNMMKNELQQLLQKNGYPVPKYQLVHQQGASHVPKFTVKCVVTNNMEDVVAEEIATASTKKDAEKKAAEQMLPSIRTLLQCGPLVGHATSWRPPPAEVVDQDMDGDLQQLLKPYSPQFECQPGISGTTLCLAITTLCCSPPVAAHGMGEGESMARRDAAVHLMDNLVTLGYNVG